MTELPIKVFSLADLVSEHSAHANRLTREIILPAGEYKRHPMFAVDTAHLQLEQHDLFKSYTARLSQGHHAMERVVLHDALVCGQGTVITEDRYLLRESAIEFLAHNLTPDGLEPSLIDDFRLTTPVAMQITRPTVLLQRPWFTNYGHWLVDGAAMLALLSRVSMPASWQIMVGAQPSDAMRDIVLETLSLLAPGVGIIERPQHEVWQFEQLHYFSPIHVPPLYKHPEAMACLRACIAANNISGSSRTKRYFICRGDMQSRRLDNEEGVISFLSTRGFTALANNSRSLHEQARLFRSAQIVVGVKGAALTNMMFATNGAHLITLSPADFPDPFFWDLVSQSGVNYSELFGELTTSHLPQSHNSFCIDIERLKTIIDAVELGLEEM